MYNENAAMTLNTLVNFGELALAMIAHMIISNKTQCKKTLQLIRIFLVFSELYPFTAGFAELPNLLEINLDPYCPGTTSIPSDLSDSVEERV